MREKAVYATVLQIFEVQGTPYRIVMKQQYVFKEGLQGEEWKIAVFVPRSQSAIPNRLDDYVWDLKHTDKITQDYWKYPNVHLTNLFQTKETNWSDLILWRLLRQLERTTAMYKQQTVVWIHSWICSEG